VGNEMVQRLALKTRLSDGLKVYAFLSHSELRAYVAWMSTQLSRPANFQTQSAVLWLYAVVIKARIRKDR
jgi:hypothetical protein